MAKGTSLLRLLHKRKERDALRNPETVLDNLRYQTKNQNYRFHRLYRNLYNPEFYIGAYGKLAKNSGNLTKGVNQDTIDGFGKDVIESLIESLKDESYKPHPVKRVYIPKKKGGRRPLGLPTFKDKLVQEVLREILNAIYEPTFSPNSHGFRNGKSCHTALLQIANTFTGTKWFIEGDIHAFFDNINHQTLVNVLRKKIADERIIRLIWKFLRSGYLDDWKFHHTFSGAPQGGIISPLLANIYLNELDKYVEKLQFSFNKGKKRAIDPEYKRLGGRIYWLKKRIKGLPEGSNERVQALAKLKQQQQLMLSMPASLPFDGGFKRLKYVRYADDFIIGIIGSKEDALQIKQDIAEFLQSQLKTELSMEKTLITHSSKFAKFLGYNLTISRDTESKTSKGGVQKRVYGANCRLYVPKDVWINKLKSLHALVISPSGRWQPVQRTALMHLDDLEILSTYNAEIRGMYNYYSLARNVNIFNKFLYVMKYSMYKTFAAKYDTSIAKIAKKYKHNGVFTVTYKVTKGQRVRSLFTGPFPRNKKGMFDNTVDLLPRIEMYAARTELTARLVANKCEICGTEDGNMQVHHVHKLKDLKGKKNWEFLMIARRRKTIVLCQPCHAKLHAGKLD